MSVMTTFPIIHGIAGGALIASPSSAFREQVRHSLNDRWRPVEHAKGGAEALIKLEEGDWQVLFLDRRLPDLDSEELIAIIQQRFPGTQVVLLDSDAAFLVEERGNEHVARKTPLQPRGPDGSLERRPLENRDLRLARARGRRRGRRWAGRHQDRGSVHVGAGAVGPHGQDPERGVQATGG